MNFFQAAMDRKTIVKSGDRQLDTTFYVWIYKAKGRFNDSVRMQLPVVFFEDAAPFFYGEGHEKAYDAWRLGETPDSYALRMLELAGIPAATLDRL